MMMICDVTKHKHKQYEIMRITKLWLLKLAPHTNAAIHSLSQDAGLYAQS